MDAKLFKQKTPEPSLEKQLKGHKNSVTALFYSPNEQQLASSSLDNSVLLWDIRSSMRSYRFQGHDEAVMDVSFSPSGKLMASASRDKTVRLWVPTVTGSTGMFKAHSQTVRSVQFSPDSHNIITASDDKIVKLWTCDKQNKFISSFVGHTNWVRCARMSNDGSLIASCSDDKTTRLWSPETGASVHVYKDQKGPGMYLAWHPSGCYIAVGTSQGNVKLYDVRTHNLVQYYSIHSSAVTQLAFHPSGSYILTSSKDGKMKVLDLLEGHPVFTLSGHSGSINAVNFSMSGDSFASAGEDKLVFVWKTNFTELFNDAKENLELSQNANSVCSSRVQKNEKQQDPTIWYKCYHSTSYPVVEFVYLDDAVEAGCQNISCPANVNGARTNITVSKDVSLGGVKTSKQCSTNICSSTPNQSIDEGTSTIFHQHVDSSFNVGHISHIPRTPPSPATFTIPSVLCGNKSQSAFYEDGQETFGVIKLRDTDVCYTNGTIEWVSRKRTHPSAGFKIFTDKSTLEPFGKKVKKSSCSDKDTSFLECDCADVLPTVSAIVGHLNALHEAVDIVDLRLTTLESSIIKEP